MTRARREIVSLEATPYYHIVSRCVRRAFLCGFDRLSQRDFSHRKKWFEQRLAFLNEIFCIDIAAFAVMSNHYHLVIFVDEKQVKGLEDIDIIQRWIRLYKPPMIIKKYINGETLNESETQQFSEIIEDWRSRLINISWYARCINEYIAIQANKEDECTGRFWEGRFKSQALLDEKALLTCMAYVDLNPIRAKIATSPENSLHTSLHLRINRRNENDSKSQKKTSNLKLLEFSLNDQCIKLSRLPFQEDDYIGLVRWTIDNLENSDKGKLQSYSPKLLIQLHIDSKKWLHSCVHFESGFKIFVGAQDVLNKVKHLFRNVRVPGIAYARTLFN